MKEWTTGRTGVTVMIFSFSDRALPADQEKRKTVAFSKQVMKQGTSAVRNIAS